MVSVGSGIKTLVCLILNPELLTTTFNVFMSLSFNSDLIEICIYYIFWCIMPHTFVQICEGENKDVHYAWVVLIPYLYKCF